MDKNSSDIVIEVKQMALETLPKMLVKDDSSFCLELSDTQLTGDFSSTKSLRYAIMCLLGLAKAERNGLYSGIDIEKVYNDIYNHIETVTIGDVGLLLWLSHRLRRDNTETIYTRLTAMLSKKAAWHEINNMELSWMMVGLSFHEKGMNPKTIVGGELYDYFITNRSAPSGLFFHSGKGIRRNFPNFANIIYPIHALSVRAGVLSDKRAGERAIEAVERLFTLQRWNGGWPWLYDALRGKVVEPYEIYSVHQDAMAPMGLRELEKATGFKTVTAVTDGLKWLEGDNEVHERMLNHKNGLIYRSIRRKKPMDKVMLYGKTACCMSGIGRLCPDDDWFLEVNRTCRPYHLGWILEAWCD